MRPLKIKSYLSSLVEVKLTLFRDKIKKKTTLINSKLYVDLSRSTKISHLFFYCIACILELTGDLLIVFHLSGF